MTHKATTGQGIDETKIDGGGRRRVVKPPYTPPDPPTLGGGDTPAPQPTQRTTATPREITFTGGTGKIPFAYGHVRPAGALLYFFVNGNDFWYVIGLAKGEDARFTSGPMDSLLGVYLPNADVTIGAGSTHVTLPNAEVWWHDGSLSQTVDANLAAVDASWNEDMIVRDPSTGLRLFGVCYAVVRLANVSKAWTQVPNLLFEMHARRVLDPRTGTIVYSEDPVLQFYDWLRDPDGKALVSTRINAPSITAAANISDQALGSGHRYRSHILMMDGTSSDDWVKTFLLLCDARYWHYTQNQWYLILDRPGSSVATYDDSTAALSPAAEGEREDPSERINEVAIEWTNTANKWTVETARLATAAVNAGLEDRRTTTFKLPWLQDPSIVQTKLAYLLNTYIYDFKLKRTHGPSTADRMVGDIITESVASRGIASQLFTIVDRRKNGDGTYDDTLLEYNTAKYADTVGSAPAKIASTFPDASSTPPDVTGFSSSSITEETYVDQFSLSRSRARIAFTYPTNYPWLDVVELYVSINGGEYRFVDSFSGDPGSAGVALYDSIMEIGPSYTYSFKLVVKSKLGSRSAGVTASKTFIGDVTPPADVPSASVVLDGAWAHLSWTAVSDADLKWYELRFGTTSSTWATAGVLGRIPRGTTTALYHLAVGTTRLFVKALDYAGNYSTNAAFVDAVVTADAPPNPTGLTLTEEIYRDQTGATQSRIKVSWTPSTAPFVLATRLLVQRPTGTLFVLGDFGSSPAYIPATLDILQYTVYAETVSQGSGAGNYMSSGVSQTITTAGKTTPPSNVPQLWATQRESRVYLAWQVAPDVDVRLYQVRRGTTSDTWATAATVLTTAGLDAYDEPPLGTWKYFIKAVDFAKNLSTTAASATVQVFFFGPAAQTEQSLRIPLTPPLGWQQYGDAMVFGGIVLEGVTCRKAAVVMQARLATEGFAAGNPADADFFISSRGYTSLQQWEDNLDAPLRQGQGIWAPINSSYATGGMLNAPAGPTIIGTSSGWRNANVKFRSPTKQIGISGPDIVSRADLSTSFSSGIGAVYLDQSGANITLYWTMSTNSRYAQTMFNIPSAAAAMFYQLFQAQPQVLAPTQFTTNASGQITVNYSMATTGGVPSLRVSSTTQLVWVVTSLTSTSAVLTFYNPATGAVAVGQTVTIEAVDAGGGGSLTISQ